MVARNFLDNHKNHPNVLDHNRLHHLVKFFCCKNESKKKFSWEEVRKNGGKKMGKKKWGKKGNIFFVEKFHIPEP